jgi:hypothetical protein
MKTVFNDEFQSLVQQSPEWEDRLRPMLEKSDFFGMLSRIRSACPIPWEINEVLKIIDGILHPPTTKTAPVGARGSRAIAGAASRVLSKIGRDRTGEGGALAGGFLPAFEALDNFRRTLGEAFAAIGERAYVDFVRELDRYWIEKTAPKPEIAISTSVRRDSAA